MKSATCVSLPFWNLQWEFLEIFGHERTQISSNIFYGSICIIDAPLRTLHVFSMFIHLEIIFKNFLQFESDFAILFILYHLGVWPDASKEPNDAGRVGQDLVIPYFPAKPPKPQILLHSLVLICTWNILKYANIFLKTNRSVGVSSDKRQDKHPEQLYPLSLCFFNIFLPPKQISFYFCKYNFNG